MPVRGWFPFAAVEDARAGVVWAMQLACPSSWQIELRRKDEGLVMMAGLADHDFGHWAKTLAPGESFESPEAYLTVGQGDVDAVAQRLLSVQRENWRLRDEPLPVLFNEYCTTWGNPTHDNLAAIAQRLQGKGIDYLVINGAECEPFLTPDTREFLECSDTIISGIEAVMKYCEIPNCVIGIERNKPECIDLMSGLVAGMKGVSVKPLPMRYPQGAEKTLIESCTGREVPKVGPTGKPGLPADAGCIVMNVTSVSTLGKFLKTGVPLVTKRLTVDGDAAAKPMNVEVPIGTLFTDIIEFCGGIKEGKTLGKAISGGPMMGLAMFGTDFPVLKQNNGLILLSREAANLPEPSACIRCGRCINGCPMGLEPVNIANAYTAKNMDELGKLNVDLCVACGSCSFVCPAKRPVTQTMRLAKDAYMGYLRSQGGK